MGVLKHYLNFRVFSFGASQVLVMLGGLLRLPVISSATNLGEFSQYIFYSSILGVLPIFLGGLVNKTRIQILTKSEIKLSFSKVETFIVIESAILIIFFLNFFIFGLTAVGDVAVLGATAVLLIRWSPYYGSQQGNGKLWQQNISQAAAAVFGLCLVFLIVQGPFWIGLNSIQKLNLLVVSTCVSACLPYLWARITQRWLSHKIYFGKRSGNSILKFISELASTLPPAALTFIDTATLQFASTPHQLSLYGVSQRLSSMATFMTGANYVQEANDVTISGSLQPKMAFRRFMIFNLVNLPFLCLFVVSSPFLVDFLSSGKLIFDWKLILGYVLVSVIQPGWVVVSNLVYTSEFNTKRLGLGILKFVIPVSVFTTVLGGYFLGAAGVVFATSLSYCFAISTAAKLVWKH